MGEMMKAVIWDGSVFPDGLRYGDFPIPEPGDDWVQFRTLACGVCGSDIHALTGRTRHLMPDRNFPAVIGHENAGVVTKVGKNVTRLAPGDRVSVEPLHGCIDFGKSCMMCRTGKYQLCEGGLNVLGMPNKDMMPGGYGEYSCAHQSHVFKISEKLSFPEAAVADVLAVAVHAVNTGDPQIGMDAVVLGVGAVGLDVVQVLRARGVRNIIAIARHAFQGAKALQVGAKHVVATDARDIPERIRALTNGRGAHQVYECVGGNAETLGLALDCAAIGGKIMLVGCATKHAELDVQELLFKEVQLLPSNSYGLFKGVSEFAAALELLETGAVDHQTLITGLYTPENFHEAISDMIDKGRHETVKPVFVRV